MHLAKLSPQSFWMVGSVFLLTGCGGPQAEDPVPVIQVSQPTDGGDYAETQKALEEESWQRFKAIGAPADGFLAKPDPSRTITDPGNARSVFENWGENYDIYLLPEPLKPVAWNDPQALVDQRVERWRKACPEIDDALRDKHWDAKDLIVLDEFIQAGLTLPPHKPLIDSNGNYVHTAVWYNETLYNWVVKNELYSDKGLEAAIPRDLDNIPADVVKFDPAGGGDKDTYYFRLQAPVGSVMLKSSWKIMPPGTDTSKFHTAKAILVFENANEETGIKYSCRLEEVGLVGLHLVFKTKDYPDWVWATFEHVDNVPEYPAGPEKGRQYNFYYPSLVDSGMDVNHPSPPTSKTPERDGKNYKSPEWYDSSKLGQKPNNIERLTPVSDFTRSLNQQEQETLGQSVWSNYLLVGTQWAVNSEMSHFTPQLLGNSTLESFELLQASCMGCHNQLTLKGNDDFQRGLGNVQSSHLFSSDDNKPPTLFHFEHNPDPRKNKAELHSDYMWSMLKHEIEGHLTSSQIKDPED